jgi:uncharacterized protein
MSRQRTIFLDPVYICAYHIGINYQWDREKGKANLLKHGVSFADAVAVFVDDAALTIEDDDPDEQRFVTIGIDAFGRVLVVVYTWRDKDIRVISARKATAREHRQ